MRGADGLSYRPSPESNRVEIETVWVGEDAQLRITNCLRKGEPCTTIRLWKYRMGVGWCPQQQSCFVKEKVLPTLIRHLLKAHEAHRGKK